MFVGSPSQTLLTVSGFKTKVARSGTQLESDALPEDLARIPPEIRSLLGSQSSTKLPVPCFGGLYGVFSFSPLILQTPIP